MKNLSPRGSWLKAERIAVVGDAHGRWNHQDVRYFDDAGYDLLLFVGDLGSGTRSDGVGIIRQLARLRTPGLVLPGNNDAPHFAALVAELAHQRGQAALRRLMGDATPVGVRPAGYSLHELSTPVGPVTLVVGRPCSMGGPKMHFPELLSRAYGISSMAESAARLCRLVREIKTEKVLFLAHNGPLGLGGAPTDPFGRDFGLDRDPAAPLDWGDPDLAEAIELARGLGKHILGVIAGHMHRRVADGERPFQADLTGVPCLNVACVPRIRIEQSVELHHHVELGFTEQGLIAQERWVELPSG